MDKIRQQKLEYFLLDLDGKIKEVKDYLLLDKGAILLDAIENFEEENAEFLQYNPSGQDELNKRKWIIQFVIFPIIADDKVEELLQYHLLEAVSANLDVEELMKMRAITISELLWPKLSQQYLKALMQNTQLIGSNPISVAGEKTSYLPYVKNWISLYNRRFGIDKHEGLESHQFILEDPNAQQLGKILKEKLLKVLKFYESLKVYSLSEIESELRKMQMGFAAQQAAAYSVSKTPDRVETYRPPAGRAGGTSQNPQKSQPPASYVEMGHVPSSQPPTREKVAAIQKEIVEDKKIKIMGEAASGSSERQYAPAPIKTTSPEEKPREIENAHISELLEKYPALQNYKLTNNSISLPIAPFSLTPTVQNWIQYYTKECGKGKHSPQERENFLESLRAKQNIGPTDVQKLEKIFRSLDEKIPLPFDKKSNELMLELVKVGHKLKTAPVAVEKEAVKPVSRKPEPVIKMSRSTAGIMGATKDEGYLDLELVPAVEKDSGSKFEI